MTMNEYVENLYNSKKDDFVKKAEGIVGNRSDAEDVVHKVFAGIVRMRSPVPEAVAEKHVKKQSERLVARRENDRTYVGDLPSDAKSALVARPEDPDIADLV